MDSTTPIITLTTDFGYMDPFVGIMKGAILCVTPNLHIIDLNHGIPPQDIKAAALTLAASVPYFPQGTIHVAVVDPGVGSERRPIVIHSAGQYFVGPDNGVFSFAVKDKELSRIVHLSNESYHLLPKSRTFHGRDVFAPVAAHLARGVPLAEFGSPSNDRVSLPWPELERAGEFIVGEILYIDRFGNLFTNVHERDLMALARESLCIHFKEIEIQGLAENYAAGDKEPYIALVNSWGLLEIASYNGNAASRSGAKIGDKVRVELLTR
ncbi:MAG TPA: SAM-dependent chlorinase/fluorinase [Candidatus Polarisedimenticolaceae bacterium]|nr:SAM-dependent chlorinase/fluorinase [Candidatus Polarisedimenticolaceae bacterium]